MLSRHSLVLILALLAFAVSLPTNDGDAWEEETAVDDSAEVQWIQAMVSTMTGEVDKSQNPAPAKTTDKKVAKVAAAKGAAAAAHAAAHLPRPIMLDAGSQGTKIFAWNQANKQMPMVFFGTQCRIRKNFFSKGQWNTLPGKGLAALAYKQAECDQETWAQPKAAEPRTSCNLGDPKACIEYLGADKAHEFERPVRCTATKQADIVPYTDDYRKNTKKSDTIKGPTGDAPMRKSYRDHLLKTISTYSSAVNGVPASNKGNIPLLATAGMRLVEKSINEDIYKAVCGGTPTADGYCLAQGKYCKTLSGTEEAYYEYLAMASGRTAADLAKRGMFTMGGASAQIAIPLTKDDVDEFNKLIASATEASDCTTFKIANRKLAPFFHKDSKAGAKGCIPDYLDIQPKSKMPQEIQDKLPADMHSVGLISFLDTMGQGGKTLMAGGKNEVGNWAAKKCKIDADKSFSECQKSLKNVLDADPIWHAVTEWFKNSVKDVTHFSFTTDNAKWSSYVPKAKKTNPGYKAAPGTSLAKEVDDACKAVADVNSDASKENAAVGNCMEALWASLYITSFFPAGSASHPESQATDDSHKFDWSDGAKAEGMLKLLQIPLARGNFHYMDGVHAELGY